ncbi:MAG: SGNH/GDSL hydrolase family protein [Pseudomonadota bacterium]
MSEHSSQKPSATVAPGQVPFRHVVLLGDALLDAYSSIDKTPGKFESSVLPGTRDDEWKLSVVSETELEREGHARALPKDATHAMIFIEGNHAIEQSGLLDQRPDALGQTLEQLSFAADEFERTLERLIDVAQAARLVIMVCTMFQPNYKDPVRQRIASAALALFNDRVTKRAAAAHVSLIDLRLVCNEPEDYDRPTLLSKRGVQKVANVIRFAMYELDVGARRSEVFF